MGSGEFALDCWYQVVSSIDRVTEVPSDIRSPEVITVAFSGVMIRKRGQTRPVFDASASLVGRRLVDSSLTRKSPKTLHFKAARHRQYGTATMTQIEAGTRMVNSIRFFHFTV